MLALRILNNKMVQGVCCSKKKMHLFFAADKCCPPLRISRPSFNWTEMRGFTFCTCWSICISFVPIEKSYKCCKWGLWKKWTPFLKLSACGFEYAIYSRYPNILSMLRSTIIHMCKLSFGTTGTLLRNQLYRWIKCYIVSFL